MFAGAVRADSADADLPCELEHLARVAACADAEAVVNNHWVICRPTALPALADHGWKIAVSATPAGVAPRPYELFEAWEHLVGGTGVPRGCPVLRRLAAVRAVGAAQARRW